MSSTKTRYSAFFKLLPECRLEVYEKVLAVPHPLYLFQEPGGRVETFAPEKPTRWLAILHTNRAIYHEARPVLYSTNNFHLVDITEQQSSLLRSFISGIGPLNAASLSRICVNFPVTERVDKQPGYVKLRDDSLQSLQLLQYQCKRLSTLEMIVHTQNSSAFRETDEFILETFRLIDEHFKAMTSLKRIVVRIVLQDGVPTASARNSMEMLGWEVMPSNGGLR